MKKIELEKVIAYEIGDKTLFQVESPRYYFSESKILANGKTLVESFKHFLYVCEGKLESVTYTYEEKINERYELKNKDLYNEKIPFIIDEHSKEKYQSLIENNLYEFKYDKEEVTLNYEIEIIKIKDNVPFDLKSDIVKKGGWYKDSVKPFYISLMQYSPLHEAIVPFPLKDLTCPVMVSKENAFLMLVDSFAKITPKNYVITRCEGSWLDVHDSRLNSSKRLLHLLQFSSYEVFGENIYGKDYKDLVESIQKLAEDIAKALREKEYEKPNCLIEVFRQERYYQQ